MAFHDASFGSVRRGGETIFLRTRDPDEWQSRSWADPWGPAEWEPVTPPMPAARKSPHKSFSSAVWAPDSPVHRLSPSVRQIPRKRPSYAVDNRIGAEFAHVWEFKDIERWLHSEGLGDTVAAFRSAKITGEDLLKLAPGDIGKTLGLEDSPTVMQICAALLPLKRVWQMSRQEAGLDASLKPKEDVSAPRLVADLHVLVDGAMSTPPGATGACIEISLEGTSHLVHSPFISASQPQGYPEFYGGSSPYSPQSSWSRTSLPEPLAFRLSVDATAIDDAEGIRVRVLAWMPRGADHPGELEVGKVDVPLPSSEGSWRIRVDQPLRIELTWIAYAAPVQMKEEDWQPLEDDSPAHHGSWYSSGGPLSPSGSLGSPSWYRS
jgi:hypothetical protein